MSGTTALVIDGNNASRSVLVGLLRDFGVADVCQQRFAAMARGALDQYLVQRGLPVTRAKWQPSTPIIGSLEGEAGITTRQLRAVEKWFFTTAAGGVAQASPTLAEKLLRATPHWTRHTHATQALQRSAELTSVRDNLRHSSISTTSIYLHSDDVHRARQIRDAFDASTE